MTKALYALAAAIVIASTVIVAAQHQRPATHAEAGTQQFAMLHAMCAPELGTGQSAQSHVPAHLAQLLQLTAQQSGEIDKVAAETCAAMVRAHAQILSVLTPEQHAKLKALHGGDAGHSSMMEFFRKLHGGK